MVIETEQSIRLTYDDVFAANQKAAEPAVSYQFDDGRALYLPTHEPLRQGASLGLVSSIRPLPPNYSPSELDKLTVPHGDGARPMFVQPQLITPLEGLFAAASEDGIPLMISSAYRSIADQQQVYDDYIIQYGQAAADAYVADPGTSEHHTGLAVDFSDAAEACVLDSDDCNLSAQTAAWLADNAPRYGFVLRYPEGESDMTGVSYEPWHYRYIGVTPARLLSDNDLTLDAFIHDIQPGLFRE